MRNHLLFIAFVFSIFSYAFPSWATPSRVILIRHAEKPNDDNAENLSPKGFQRAAAMAHIFQNQPHLADRGLPFLFAAAYVSGSHSKRCIQTLEPLSKVLKVQIQAPYAAEDFRKMANFLLNSPELDGKAVMIAWKHTEIVDLAKALRAKPLTNKWKGKVFDRMWVIDYYQNGKVDLMDLPEKLLPGDDESIYINLNI
jgi:hypothetical protein